MTTTAPVAEIKDQAAILLGQVAGYVGHRTIGIGLRSGLIRALADTPDGATAGDLTARTGHDQFYVGVWCRSALACGLCERDGDTYRLAPHMATLLLDENSPAYAGGIFALFEQHELFDRFEQVLGTGERMWWHDTSPAWIDGVSKSGRPFYTRLVPGGLGQIPGLPARLADDGSVIVDTGCGAGLGLVRLAEHYPGCELIGVDGDAHSIEVARGNVEAAGVAERVRFVTAPLEEFTIERPASLVVNNITMHECRDIDRVTERVKHALEPGGLFVISDFPFPDTDEELTTVPGRVMAGVQFFESQIDDQLLPRQAYDALLQRHGFTDLGTTTLTPVHALTWAAAPDSTEYRTGRDAADNKSNATPDEDRQRRR